IQILSDVAEGWLDAENQFRKLALEQTWDAGLGFSRATLEKGLDNFFRQLTAENLEALLEQELGDARRLDEMVAVGAGHKRDRAAMAVGPEFLVHIAAGNVPNPALMSIVLGLLTRSAQFVKCASGAAFLPRLFAHSLYEADRKLAACLEIGQWKGGHHALESALFAEADCVIATGSDEMLAAVRHRIPAGARFLGYGLRVSFGYITDEAFLEAAREVAERAAADVSAWNQLGCLSPHVMYIEGSGGGE